MKITYKHYLDILDISHSNIDELDKKIQTISIYTGKSIDYLENLPINELNNISNKIEYLDISKKTKPKFTFKIKGKRYIIKWKIQELSAAQFIDINHFMKEGDIDKNLHHLLACLTVRYNIFGKCQKYNSDEHDLISEYILNEMEFINVYNISNFFLQFFQNFEIVFQNYLDSMITKEITKAKELVKTIPMNKNTQELISQINGIG